jgi:succinate dehydrogenase flavin-adding protein (antitoxin of CptAB toxin-antitoxin module)
MSMLDYHKVVLENVSFDSALFLKELKKAFQRLLQPEAEELLAWCLGRYRFP